MQSMSDDVVLDWEVSECITSAMGPENGSSSGGIGAKLSYSVNLFISSVLVRRLCNKYAGYFQSFGFTFIVQDFIN